MEATGTFLTAQKVSTCLLLCYAADMPASEEREALSAFLMKEVSAMRANAVTQYTWREMRENLLNALQGSDEEHSVTQSMAKSVSQSLSKSVSKSVSVKKTQRQWEGVSWLEEQLSSINAPHELFVLFEEMRRIREEHFNEEATVNSIFGCFLDETTITFDSLLFDGVSRLFLSIQEWAPRRGEGELKAGERKGARGSLLKAHTKASFRLFEDKEEEEEEEENSHCDAQERWEDVEEREFPVLVRLRSLGSSTPHGLLSAAEVELFVAREADQIQGMLLTRSREGEREREGELSMRDKEGERVFTEREISERIEELRRMAPKVSAVHYLALVFEIQRRNVSRARDELHRYFDHQVYEHAIRRREKGGNGKEGASKRSSLLPFALLNLASLHFLFSDYDEGVQAVSEAVRLAQASSDQGVLALGLTWLHRLLQQQMCSSRQEGDSRSRSLYRAPLPESSVNCSLTRSFSHSSEGVKAFSGAVSGGTSALATTKFFMALLERCVAMAEKESLPYLSSLNSLAISELLLNAGAPVLPVADVSDLPLFSLGESTSGLLWQVLDMSDRKNAQNALRSLAAKGQLLRSTCWADFGHSDLSRLYAVIPLLSCAPEQSEIAKVRMRTLSPSSSSHSSSSSRGRKDSLATDSSLKFVEEFCGACCKLAFQLAEEGKVQDAYLTLTQLETLLPTSSLPREQALAVTKCWLHVRVRESLCKGDPFLAVLLMEEASALDPSESTSLLELDVARALGRYPAALSAANRSLAVSGRAFDAGQQKRQIPLLLWTARAHRENGQSALALKSALKALSLCHEAHLFTMKAAACLELAAAHLSLQCPSRAVAIVQALLPQILRHSPLIVRGEAQFLLARALATRAKIDRCSPGAKKRTFTAAIAQLGRAIGCFEELDMMDMLAQAHHLAALLYAALGEEEKRNKAAGAFLAAREKIALSPQRAPFCEALPGGIRRYVNK